jgi:clan AA aspartic protease (TIGR02281 family)
MKHALQVVLIAMAGFYAGWLARDNFIGDRQAAPVSTADAPPPLVPATAREITPQAVKTLPVPAEQDNFQTLLAARRFEEAVQFYVRTEAAGEQQLPPLRAALLAWLQGALAQGDTEGLMALADAWLSSYYDDIDVLMILAEHQRRQGHPEEAARTVQFALTYALQPGQLEKVSRFFQGLVEKTDATFARQQQWIELLGFYQLLESIGLGLPEYQLRHAEILLELGDVATARDLLVPLTQQAGWAGKANELLALTEPREEPAAAQARPGEAIALRRRGGHYLVEAGLNGVSDVTLMIDTGASITSLSQASFAELSKNSRFDFLGWRLFNTANGVTRGNIYRAASLRLGDKVLQQVDIAVLDFRPDGEVDGLLGMNVLQHYRFEIDQDRGVLYLGER